MDTNKVREITPIDNCFGYRTEYGDYLLETTMARLRTSNTSSLMSQRVVLFCDNFLVTLTVRHLQIVCPSLGTRESNTCPDDGGKTEKSVSLMLGERCFSLGHAVFHFMEKGRLLYIL